MVAVEEPGKYYLQHFRTKGSKNGERLYQYKDGSLTPLGRIHYGVGKRRSGNAQGDSQSNSSNQENKKSFGEKFKERVEKTKTKLKEAKEKRKQENEDLKAKSKEARDLTDEELKARIDRLNKEKQYAQLLAERNEREKSAFSKFASKLLSDTANKLSTQAMDLLVNKSIEALKSKLDDKEKRSPTLGEFTKMDLSKMPINDLMDMVKNPDNLGKLPDLQAKLKEKLEQNQNNPPQPNPPQPNPPQPNPPQPRPNNDDDHPNPPQPNPPQPRPNNDGNNDDDHPNPPQPRPSNGGNDDSRPNPPSNNQSDTHRRAREIMDNTSMSQSIQAIIRNHNGQITNEAMARIKRKWGDLTPEIIQEFMAIINANNG